MCSIVPRAHSAKLNGRVNYLMALSIPYFRTNVFSYFVISIVNFCPKDALS